MRRFPTPETVIDSAIETYVRTPIAVIEYKSVATPTPIRWSPQETNFRRQHPGAPSNLPAVERPIAPNTGNAKLDRKYQQQSSKRNVTNSSRSKDQEHVQLDKLRADDATRQQLEQQHQQQTQQLQQKHDQERQELQQKQQPANREPGKR